MPGLAIADLRRLASLAAALALAACTTDAAVAPPSTADDEPTIAGATGAADDAAPRIIYTTNVGANANRAMSIRPDGTDPRSLLGGAQQWTSIVSLTYSPTRDRILYHGDGTLYVARRDGTGAVGIGHDSLNVSTRVRWSPDGQLVLGTRFWPPAADDRGGTVFVMRADGGGVQRLPVGTSDYALWTPGGLVAVQGNLSRGEGWEYVDLNGTVVRTAAARDHIAMRQGIDDTSPDGRLRAYVSPRSGIFLVDQVSADTVQILARAGVSHRVRWSPDGRHLAALAECSASGLEPGELLVVAADGGGARTIARDVFCRGGFDW